MILTDDTRLGGRVRTDRSAPMTDSSWDQYVAIDDGGSSLDPLAGTSADTIKDEVLAGQAENDLSDAATASDWADWNGATGDEATTSANSYFDAAAEAVSSGAPDLAAEDVSDGNMELGVAAGGYGDAASYDDTASSYLQGAGDDLSSLSAYTGDGDLASAATDATEASDDYSAAANDYSDASVDASSYADDSSGDASS